MSLRLCKVPMQCFHWYTFKSADWAFHITWSKCCLCVGVCLDVNQGATNNNRCTQWLVILHAKKPTNEPWSHAKNQTRSVWPTSCVKIPLNTQKSAWISQLSVTVHVLLVIIAIICQLVEDLQLSPLGGCAPDVNVFHASSSETIPKSVAAAGWTGDGGESSDGGCEFTDVTAVSAVWCKPLS